MKCMRLLDVVVVATMLASVFHFFCILVPHDIVRRSEVLHSEESRARLLNLFSAEGNLTKLHQAVEQCLVDNGDGIKAIRGQGCNIRLQYPNGTENSWGRTRPAVVTQEVFDCYLEEETLKRNLYHFVSRQRCKEPKDCFQLVRRFLPVKQPLAPGQGGRCALVVNAASLMSDVAFGHEIDAHDTVIRINDGRTGPKYANWTGQKTTFRFVNERVTKALLPFIRKFAIINETIVLRRALGGSSLKKLQAGSMGNTIYVSPLTDVGSELEADHLLGYSSGFLALNFAISICKSVDMYGFSVDPGTQPSWPRYFSGPKFGHMPLTNRAYFLLLECLQVVRLKSAERVMSSRKTTLPTSEVIQYGYTAGKAHEEGIQVKDDHINRCHRTTASSTRQAGQLLTTRP